MAHETSKHELQLHPLDFPFALRWTSNFGFQGILHFRDNDRLVLVLESPCCGQRLLQKTTPPTCLSCDHAWTRFTDLDSEWREFYYPEKLFRIGDPMAEDSFRSWLQTPLEVLTDHFNGILLAGAVGDRFRELRLATREKFGDHDAWKEECFAAAGTRSYGQALTDATKDLWAEKIFTYAELLQEFSGDLLLTHPVAPQLGTQA